MPSVVNSQKDAVIIEEEERQVRLPQDVLPRQNVGFAYHQPNRNEDHLPADDFIFNRIIYGNQNDRFHNNANNGNDDDLEDEDDDDFEEEDESTEQTNRTI